jgi:hypothetical protein
MRNGEGGAGGRVAKIPERSVAQDGAIGVVFIGRAVGERGSTLASYRRAS